MMGWFHRQKADSLDERYASEEELRQLFDAGKDGFLRLAYALTADCSLAQECLVSGLEDCRNTNTVFREWAHQWARHVIIGNAIRLLRQTTRHETTAERQPIANPCTQDLLNDAPAVDRLLTLPDSERVIYVRR